ncbi:MAG: IclR family transcriptional regulator, partial [Chloroflexi bacterium]|nr:IclR family transcriptional regulator [Chloroflexota bacterium]
GIPRATAHRLLKTLVHHELLIRTSESKYRMSLRLLELGTAALATSTLQQEVYPFLVALVQATQETAHFAVIDGYHVGYAAKVDSPHPIRMYSYVGWRGPLHATAAGKVLLAFSDSAFMRSVLEMPLNPFTARTKLDREQLLEELRCIRSSGYAVDDEELLDGLMCIAVPVVLHDRLYGAISLSGPKGRMSALPLKETVVLLQQQRNQFADQLEHGETAEQPR